MLEFVMESSGNPLGQLIGVDGAPSNGYGLKQNGFSSVTIGSIT